MIMASTTAQTTPRLRQLWPTSRHGLAHPAKRRTAVITFVITLLLLAAGALYGLDAPKHLMHGGFDDPASESSRASEQLDAEFRGGTPNLVVILSSNKGVDHPEVVAAAHRVQQAAQASPSVTDLVSYWDGATPTLRSQDGTQGLIMLHVAGNTDKAARNAAELAPALAQAAGSVRIALAGEAQVQSEVGSRTEHDLLRAELIAAPLTLLTLVLVFGSVVSALLPLVIAGTATVATMAILKVIVHFTPVSVYSANITTALGLGLAIDYSLFIVSRFREELTTGQTVNEALATTMRTAGRTVFMSAITVALSLSALLVFPLFFLRSFAYGGITVVMFSAAGALIVLPALLLLIGRRVDTFYVLKRCRSRGPTASRDTLARGWWYRTAKRIMRRPYTSAVVALALLITLGSPFLRASFGLTDDRVLPPEAPAHLATQELRTHFDDSAARAIPVLVQSGTTKQTDPAITDYAAQVSALPNVERVDTATGSYVNGRRLSLPNGNSPRFSSAAATWLDVIAKPDPMSASGTKLVHDIRQTPAPTTVLVGGTAAMLADTTAAISHWAPLAVAIIVLSMFVLLFLFTGSVFLPFKALLLNALSLTATFGAMVFVFQEGHLGWLIGKPTVTGLIDITLPILVFCIAFGLSMDYQVFLISRIRERYLMTGDNVESIAVGLGLTGRIITSAAGILAVVLIMLATSGITLLKLVGVGLTIAIVIDATVVRTVLVPAFMKIARRANWWAPPALRHLHERFGLGDRPAPE